MLLEIRNKRINYWHFPITLNDPLYNVYPYILYKMQIPWIIQGACFPSIFLLSRSFVRDPRSEKPMAVMPRILAFLCLGDEAENSGGRRRASSSLKRSQGFRKTRETIGVSFLGFMGFTLDLWDETNISPENQRLVQMKCPSGFRPICRGELLVLGRFFLFELKFYPQNFV